MTTSPFQSEPNPYQAPPVPHGPTMSPPGSGQAITPNVIELLAQTRPWVLFMSILGFLGSGLMVAGGLVGGLGMAAFGGGGAAVVLLIYPVLGVIYFFPALFLFRYSQSIRDLRYSQDVGHLENALSAQKSFWRYVGIVTAVIITLYAAIFAVAAVFGVLGAMSR